ncbi:Cytosine permease [subsurface metagenome]
MAKEEKELMGVDALVRDYERMPVPEERQKNWYNMGMVWGGVAACIICLLVGGTIGFWLDLKTAAIAVLCGSLITTAIGAICAVVGGRLHLSTPMIARFAFGNRGVIVVALAIAVGCFGWFAFQLGFFGVTFQAATGLMTGVAPGMLGLWLAIIIGGILMTVSAVFGYRALAWLSLVTVPIILALWIYSLVVVLGQYSWSELLAQAPADPKTLAVAISFVAGGFMVGAVITPDVSRYAKSTGHSVGGVILGFFVIQAVLMYMGAILAHAVGDWNMVNVMLGLGLGTAFGIIAMLVFILAQWTTNDNNLYSAALSFSVIFRGARKWWLTAAAGALGIILALPEPVNVWGHFPEFISSLCILIPPIAGVYIADYFIVNRNFYKYENLPKVANARWLMLASWAVASFIGFCTTPAGASIGTLGWFNITTIPAIDTFLIGFVLALILGCVYKRVKGGWPEATPA